MGQKYTAVYKSIALHLGVYFIVILSLPSVLKSPELPIVVPPISIEFIDDTQETAIAAPNKSNIEAEPEMTAPIVERIDKKTVTVEPVINDSVEPVINGEVENKLIEEFEAMYFTLENSEVISLADWILRGLDKSQLKPESSSFADKKSLSEIARAIAASKIPSGLNPLLGDGKLPLGPLELPAISDGSPTDVLSLVSKRHMRRKEGAYTGGIYGSVGPGDENSAGTGIIAYEANISNCAHEEARTGVNRCRAFERWISQKVYEVIKSQEKQK